MAHILKPIGVGGTRLTDDGYIKGESYLRSYVAGRTHDTETVDGVFDVHPTAVDIDRTEREYIYYYPARRDGKECWFFTWETENEQVVYSGFLPVGVKDRSRRLDQ